MFRFLIFLIPFFLFATDLHFLAFGRYFTCVPVDHRMRYGFDFILNSARTSGDFYQDNIHYSCTSISGSFYNSSCLADGHSVSKDIRFSDGDIYPNVEHTTIYFNLSPYCLLSKCSSYSTLDHVCLDKNNQPVCSHGKIWSSSQEKCVFDCNSIKDKAIQKCGGENYIKSYTCSQDGNYSIICYTCSDIMNIVFSLCSHNHLKVKDGLSCSSKNSLVTLNFAFPPSVSDVCVSFSDTNDTNNINNINDTNDTNNTNNINNSDNTNIINSLNHLQNKLHSDNTNIINSLNDLQNKFVSSFDNLHSDLSNISHINSKGFSTLHSDLSNIHSSLNGINSELSDINSSLRVFKRLNNLIEDNTSFISGAKDSILQGINKYSDKNFVTSDTSTSNMCLSDVSFTIYGKTITLKVSEIANSIYVTLVKAILWLSASLFIFFNCFRTD